MKLDKLLRVSWILYDTLMYTDYKADKKTEIENRIHVMVSYSFHMDYYNGFSSV